MIEADEKTLFFADLDAAANADRPYSFWWRDDDAADVTPALSTLLALQARHDIPLALAVIPDAATAALAAVIAGHDRVYAFQHGWRHHSHADRDKRERAAEFGEGRPVDAALSDLRQGFDALARLMPDRFLPVLTPPWNRIADAIARRCGEAGLEALSAFGPEPDHGPGRVINCHMDPIAWKKGRGFVGRAKAWRLLNEQTAPRRRSKTPIGILTHHQVHDIETTEFLDELFGLLKAHPGVVWPDLPDLFRLTPVAGHL